MDKFKEWLNSISNLDYIDPTIVIEEYDKFHPTTIKLSEIVERLNNSKYLNKQIDTGCGYNNYWYLKKQIDYPREYTYIRYHSEFTNEYYKQHYIKKGKSVPKIKICANKIININIGNCDVYIEEYMWLYKLMSDGTEIINDLEGENG
jgi:hypothetical protein